MKKHTLQGDKRTVFGRKTKGLRKNKITPATLYGKGMKSESIQVDSEIFKKLYAQTGESGLIELTVGKTVYPVLVNVVQIHPVTREYVHVEFHTVNLKEKIQANIPVTFTGQSKAVEEKAGILLTLLDEVEVEALPTDFPESISVDISGLEKVDDEILVGSISLPSGVTMVTPLESGIIRVGALISHEAEEAAAAEAAAQAEAKVESADATEAEAEKTEKKEDKPEEKKPEPQEK